MALSMFATILIPFVFILLVLLLVKAPKVGVALLGAIILAVAGLVGVRFLAFTGAPGVSPPGVGKIVIVIPFIFVLLVLALVKSPKAGATLIGVIVFLVLAGLVIQIPVASHNQRTERGVLHDRSVERMPQILPEGVSYEPVDGLGLTRVKQEALPNDSRASGATSPVWSEEALNEWLKIENERQRVLSRGAGASNEPSSIWSEGVENEYEADIYPSKLAATRALGRRMRGPIEAVIADMDTATKIVIFQDENDPGLAKPFKQALAETLSDVPCSVLYGSRNIDDDEIGITLRSDYVQGWGPSGGESQIIKTQVLADARHRDWDVTIAQEYIEKPWVENFSAYASERPQGQFVVARSWEACTSENEARDLALRDACNQVSALVAQKWPGRPAQTVSSTDLLDGGFVLDQFVQSFDGMSSRLWREAMLIDTSAQKLKRLGSRMAAQVRVERITWAGMILSAIGVLLVIIVAYVFLNMATKGYYVWSLRIAGMVLAVAGVVSILLVLR